LAVLAAAPTPMAGHALSVEMIVLTELSHQIDVIQGELATHFGRHSDRDIYLSQPGLGVVLAARVLVEFGDAPGGYANAKARRNYAGTSPITRASGKKTVVRARYARNNRLTNALVQQAFAALTSSPGARAFYKNFGSTTSATTTLCDAWPSGSWGILHGCLRHHTTYQQATAWPATYEQQQAA
jgi:transposase